MNDLLGIDIGGTTMSLGRVEDGQITEKILIDVNSNSLAEDLISDLLKGINFLNTNKIRGIGIGVPAVVDPILGIVFNVQNKYYHDSLVLALQTFAYPKQIENLKIKVSDTADTAVLGAAALCVRNEYNL